MERATGMRQSQRADYGLYGSIRLYSTFFAIALILTVVALFSEQFRILSLILLSVNLFIALLLLALSKGRKRLVRQVVERADIKAGDRVLDVGTGRGFLAVEIAKTIQGREVVGIDLWQLPAKDQMHKGFIVGNTKENAERNAELEGVSDRVAFQQCDARQMPFEAESFDVVVSSFALHQMIQFGKDGFRVLDEIQRVLKPAGRFVDTDLMISKVMSEYLRKIGFNELRIDNVLRIGPFAVKILSARKSRNIDTHPVSNALVHHSKSLNKSIIQTRLADYLDDPRRWRSFHRSGSRGFLRRITVDLGGWLLQRFGSSRWIVLTTRGRRTGKPHSVLLPCVLDRNEDTVYVISTDGFVADWVKNIESDGQVLLIFKRRRLSGKAQLISDAKDKIVVVRRLDGRWEPRPFFIVLKMLKKDIISWITERPLVAIHLDTRLADTSRRSRSL